MKYYSEEDMKDLRLGFDEKVLQWQQVSTKKMFGCPCYKANGKLFAFLVTNGIVITKLAQADRETISSQRQPTAFQAGKKIVQKWVRIPVKNKRDMGQIMLFVRKSYESALQEA